MSLDSRRDISSSSSSCFDAADSQDFSIDQQRPLADLVDRIASAAENSEIAIWQCKFLARFVEGFVEEQSYGGFQSIVKAAVIKCLELVSSCGRSRAHWLEKALLKEENQQEFEVAVEDLCKSLALARILPDEGVLLGYMEETLASLRASSLEELSRRDRLEILQKSKLLSKTIDREKNKQLHQMAQTLIPRLDPREMAGAYRINPAELQRGKTIGHSQSIRVYQTRWLRQSFAEKVLPVDLGSNAAPLFHAIHPNLVRVLGIAPRGDQGCSLVMELMSTNLSAVIAGKAMDRARGEDSQPGPFSLDQSLDIMLQIARGMRCLHDLRMIHTNLKTRNALVSFSRAGDFIVKLSDFGLAKILSRIARTSSRTGSAKRMVFDQNGGSLYSREADVRDFAMVCYEILGGDDGLGGIPDYIVEFLSRCRHEEDRMRPEFSEICDFLGMIRGLETRSRNTKNTKNTGGSFLADLSADELEALVYYLGENWLLRNAVEQRTIPLGALREWIQDSSALSEATKIKIQVGMGDLMADWRGSEHKFLEARTWYRMAALLGDPEALWRLGMIYERGGGGGIQANAVQAMCLYRESAAKDYTNAIVELGRCYSFGLVDRSESEASENLKVALERQDEGGNLIAAIQELMETITAGAMEDAAWASNRLVQISCCSREGRMLVAGPHSRNLKVVVELLSREDQGEAARYNLVKLIQNLAMEPGLLQRIVFVDGVQQLTRLLARRSSARAGVDRDDPGEDDLAGAIVECLWAMIQRESGGSKFAVYQAVRSGLVACLLLPGMAYGGELLLAECLRSDAGGMWLEEPANLELLRAKNPKKCFEEP